MNQPWAERFWDADGALKPLAWLDLEMARLHPEDWRAAIGLPDGLPEAATRYAP